MMVHHVDHRNDNMLASIIGDMNNQRKTTKFVQAAMLQRDGMMNIGQAMLQQSEVLKALAPRPVAPNTPAEHSAHARGASLIL